MIVYIFYCLFKKIKARFSLFLFEVYNFFYVWEIFFVYFSRFFQGFFYSRMIFFSDFTVIFVISKISLWFPCDFCDFFVISVIWVIFQWFQGFLWFLSDFFVISMISKKSLRDFWQWFAPSYEWMQNKYFWRNLFFKRCSTLYMIPIHLEIYFQLI